MYVRILQRVNVGRPRNSSTMDSFSPSTHHRLSKIALSAPASSFSPCFLLTRFDAEVAEGDEKQRVFHVRSGGGSCRLGVDPANDCVSARADVRDQSVRGVGNGGRHSVNCSSLPILIAFASAVLLRELDLMCKKFEQAMPTSSLPRMPLPSSIRASSAESEGQHRAEAAQRVGWRGAIDVVLVRASAALLL